MAGAGGIGRAALVAAAVVVSIGLGDQLLRVVLLDEPTAYWLSKHAPGARVATRLGDRHHEWTTNAGGFHDRDHPAQPSAGARRIVCIGDSFLDGPTDPSMPQLLEQELRASDPAAEVVNLSAPGIGPQDYLAILVELGLATGHWSGSPAPSPSLWPDDDRGRVLLLAHACHVRPGPVGYGSLGR